MLLFTSFFVANPVPLSAQESITYTYDALGRLLQVNHGTSGPNANVSATYNYDRADNRTQVLVSTGPATLTLSPGTLANAVVGSAYNQMITASGGSGGYGFAVSAGNLPPGLSLSSAGALSGIPTTAVSYSFTVIANDTNGSSGSRAYGINISPANDLTLSPTTLPAGTVGIDYNQTITANGGSGPYSFTTTASTLPPGLTLSSGGLLSGTPNSAGSYSFTVNAVDSTGNHVGGHSYTATIGNGAPPPVANPDAASTTVCGTVTVNVTANDTDPSGNYPLQVTAIVSSTMGTAAVVSSTSVEFDAFGRSGTGVVTYTVANSKGATANGTLSVTISGAVCP